MCTCCGKKVSVILDTDIGYDIDDTWALGLLLKSPEVDLKYVLSATHDTTYAAKLLAKFLTVADRADIPVGVGIKQDDLIGGQARWVEDYDLASYPGTVYEDGVGALVDMIMNAPEPMTLLCIGPLPNIAAALEREPRIAARAHFVGMHGSLRYGHDGRSEVVQEYNVKCFPQAGQKVFTAPWDMTITPLDTCSLITLRGEKYQRVLTSDDPVARAIMENYRLWLAHDHPERAPLAEQHSSVLFDTVGVYLTFSTELLTMERLGVRVTDDGSTVIDESAKQMDCAMGWKDLGAFEDLLVQRLTHGCRGRLLTARRREW